VPFLRILILRLSSIGDLVLVSPLLRGLQKRFPHAAIDVAVKDEFSDLVRYHPAVQAVHVVRKKDGLRGLLQLGRDLRRREYDILLDLHRNFRTVLLGLLCGARQRFGYRKHRLRRWLYVRFKWNTMARTPPVPQRYLLAAAPLGVQSDGAGTEIFWTPQHEAEAEQALLAAGWKPGLNLTGLAPGAGYFTKRWPIEYFVELAGGLLQRDQTCSIAVLGGAQDRELAQLISRQDRTRILDLTGRCTVLASAAIVKRCQLLVTNDSGLMHIAEAVHTPLLAIFGSTTGPLGFFPQLASSRVLENQQLNCRPCSHLGHRACPLGHFRCMREILPPRVLDEMQKIRAAMPFYN
jgi:heptosyltransferase-2